MSQRKPIMVSLEGNIGAGKSTILAALESIIQKDDMSPVKWVFLKEPVDLWDQVCDKEGRTMLSKFYSDPAKYSFAFQIMAFSTRLKMLRDIVRENPDLTGIICERSLEADRNIFASMLHADGLMEDVEYQIYQQYIQGYDAIFDLDGIIYIDSDARTCFERVSKRSREGESNISLEYLEKCRDYHERWLRPLLRLDERPLLRLDERPLLRLDERPLLRLDERPLLRLDTSCQASFHPIDQQGEVWLNQIIDFLYKLV